ncbi:hypothetical protein F5887DRAFT_961288 [Amanita rubescens]|nr:hypothetical protein F5887DRAFT_961288 [Amanita rubescens]
MLFLYTLLFFLLGTSVVALPSSPPTSHLTRRRKVSDDSELNGYWLYSKENNNRIINIKNNQILEALPKLKDPVTDLLHNWKRATKSSVKASNLPVPEAMMKNIPTKANGDKLKIVKPIQGLHFEAKFKPSGSPKGLNSWEDKVLEVMQNAIDESGSGAT